MNTAPLPHGFRVVLDRDTRRLAEGLWYGGAPARVLRLTAAGRAAWAHLAREPVDSPATGALARRLTDAGLAHPVPPAAGTTAAVTVVVPVRDRAALLDRCLAGLGTRYPVVVVDDGSRDPAAVAKVAADHGATLIHRSACGGPAAARNTGLARVTTDLVALVDSDCAPGPGWIDRLAGHFADPAVAAVAPRITPLAGDTWAGRYTRAAGALDLGSRPGRVVPGTRLSYVPTAALLARRAALVADERRLGAAPTSYAAGDHHLDAVFDPDLRVGEDVDLVWRLHDAGWRIRYDPSVQVGHHEPAGWRGLVARRWRYGTSAAPLAVRHPGKLTHLIVPRWPALVVAALLARRPLLAAGAYAAGVASSARTLHTAGLPDTGRLAARAQAAAAGRTWLAAGRYATQFAAPLLVALALPGGRTAATRRAAAGSLLLGPPLVRWAGRRPALDPVRYCLGALAEDVAYGAGVWAGCLAHRTTEPLRPILPGTPYGTRGIR